MRTSEHDIRLPILTCGIVSALRLRLSLFRLSQVQLLSAPRAARLVSPILGSQAAEVSATTTTRASLPQQYLTGQSYLSLQRTGPAQLLGEPCDQRAGQPKIVPVFGK